MTAARWIGLGMIFAAACALGCGSDDTTGTPTGGGGSGAGSGGTAANSPDTSSSGAAGSATTASGGSSNIGGSSGAGGEGGGQDAATIGIDGNSAADSAAADQAAAKSLDKFQLLDPCDLTTYKVEASASAVCPQLDAVKNQHVSRQFGGDPNVTYNVTLNVRGIIEHYWYEGGTLDPVSKVFYTGGVPTVGGLVSACKNLVSTLPFPLPAEISPSDMCFNGFNVFAMTISAPKQHYYLNYTADKVVDRPPHAVYNDDYTVTIQIKGQAALDFYIIGSDEHQCYNHDKTLAGVTLPSSPYIGEFVQFDVVSISHAP